MIDGSTDFLNAVRPFVPHFRFMIDDLAALTPATLASRSLDALPRLVQLALWASRSFPRLRDAAPYMRPIVGSLVRDERTRELLTQVFLYVLSTGQADVDVRAIRTILLDVAGPQAYEEVMNGAEQLMEIGRAEGFAKGQAEGLRTAIVAALSARGMVLSELARARLAGCSEMSTLTQWLTRALTAAAESDIFHTDDAR
jgi:hypothetical protein